MNGEQALERISILRRLVDNMNKKYNTKVGLEAEDYHYFFEDVETIIADAIVLDLEADEEPRR